MDPFECGANPQKWAEYLIEKMKLDVDQHELAGHLSNVIEISHSTKLNPVTAELREVG